MDNNLHNTAHEVQKNDKEKKSIKFCVAGINTEILCPYGYYFHEFLEYYKEYSHPDIVIELSQEDIDKEREFYPELKKPNISVDNEKVAVTYDYGCLEPSAALKKMADAVIPFDAFVFHGAVIEKDGYGYMFTAPSGIGKSTRISLWKDIYPNSVIVNGDKPIIRFIDGMVYSCGTPWSGKEGWDTNMMVPLRAVFLLERAESDENNSVEEISIGQAFPTILQQIHRPTDANAMRKTIHMITQMSGKVKFYRFRSAPTHKAVQLAYETARPRK